MVNTRRVVQARGNDQDHSRDQRRAKRSDSRRPTPTPATGKRQRTPTGKRQRDVGRGRVAGGCYVRMSL